MEKRNTSTFTPSLLGSCLGVIVSFALIALIITLSVIFGSKGETTSVRKNSVLLVRLEGIIPEKTGNTMDENAFLAIQDEAIGLQRLCNIIKHAETDSKIKGIFLEKPKYKVGRKLLWRISFDKFEPVSIVLS